MKMVDRWVSRYVLISSLVYLSLAYYEERVDGDNILGAMIPIHMAKEGQLKKVTCGKLNFEGVAAGEALRFAVDEINKGKSPRTFGYNLLDTCNSAEGAKDAAYNFILRLRKYRKTKQGQKPVSVVVGSFGQPQYQASQLLSLEELPQISYAPNNVQISPPQNGKRGGNEKLLSTYPGDTLKVVAAIEVMKELKVEYFTVIVSNDARGHAGRSVISDTVEYNSKFCSSKIHSLHSKSSVKKVVSEIRRNPLAKAVLLHLDREKCVWVLEEAKRQNLTDVVWVSTMLWSTADLKKYREEVEGMISVGNTDLESHEFKTHINALKLPYKGNPFLRSVFLELGGSKQCLEDNTTLSDDVQKQCDEKHREIKSQLHKYNAKVSHVLDAVAVYAEGMKRIARESGKVALLKAMKEVDIKSPMTHHIIKFNSSGILLDVMSMIFNIQLNTNVPEMIRVGTYNYKGNPKLTLNSGILKWKNGSKTVPISKCSSDCQKGYQRVFSHNRPKCCWSCTRCPNGSVSVKVNSETCKKCDSLSVPDPSQASCAHFKTTSFRWFDPVGEFMIFLITAGLCATFFTLGIFSQNRDCDVVKSADYKLMTFMLFGLALCFFTPVPLLLRPTTATCMAYVIMFSFGLTIPLAILFIKSAAVRYRFFDENMELINGTLGSMPHLVIAGIIISIQAIILAIGINVTSASVDYYPTDKWDLKYTQCSYVKNAVFWVSFGYNVAVSVIMNIASSRSVKMTEDYREQRWISLTTCVFYLVTYLFVICIYSVYGANVVEAASVIIVLFGFTFIIVYFAPKLRLILFKQKAKQEFGPDGNPLLKEEETPQKALAPHMSGIDGLKRHKVLGLKVKEETSTA